MASSKNSETEHKSEAADSSKPEKKASNPRKEKQLDKKNKSNKPKKKVKKLNNSDVSKEDKEIVVPSSSTESHENAQEEEPQEDQTEVTNGRTSATKPKKGKVKGMKYDDEDEAEGKGDAKDNVFPMNRIRTVIRGQDLDLRISQEAIFVINKATEMFLEHFTRDTHASCVRDRKKSLAYKHLSSVVSKESRYDFLTDFVPEKIKAEDALRERNSGVNGG